MANIPDPITRKEQYYSYMAGESSYLPEPITREERYLYYLCINGQGGGGSGGTSKDVIQVDHGISDTTFELPPNQYHTWGEVASLTLTLGAETSGQAGGYWFSFDSGDTATTLSLPETVITDIVVEPNMHYECSIVGNYMTFEEWEVSA